MWTTQNYLEREAANEVIEKLNEMISEFEDLDDVQNVFHNVGNL